MTLKENYSCYVIIYLKCITLLTATIPTLNNNPRISVAMPTHKGNGEGTATD